MLKKTEANGLKAVPLLTYWTRLYMLVLLLSLLLLAVIAGVWIRINAYNQRYEINELRAEQMAAEYEQLLESGVPPRGLKINSVRSGPFLVQIVDKSGVVYTFNGRNTVPVPPALLQAPATLQEALSGKTVREQVRYDSQTWLRVGVPVYEKGSVSRALYVSSHTMGVLEQISRLYGSLAIVYITIALVGWIVIYFLSRRLTRPLRQVAAAAQSVARGEYSPVLPQQVKELELQQLVLSFKNMASQLEELEKLRTSLLAGVSHELRTPVTSIRGMIQAVHGRVVTGREADEFLQISLDESKRLQQMVEDLLDFSSLEAGAAPLEKEEVDLIPLVEEVLQQLLVLPGFSSINLERDLPVDPVILEGDRDRLRQILINLLENSSKAGATLIKVIVRAAAGQVIIDVQDNGRGVALNDRPYIFERFYRGGEGKEKNHGLGLGLTISRLLARAHGGDLILPEASGQSTIFRLWLPAGSQARIENSQL
ncbi:MAG: sensor histidine kinase [Desulfocucumaceae bacterium]